MNLEIGKTYTMHFCGITRDCVVLDDYDTHAKHQDLVAWTGDDILVYDKRKIEVVASIGAPRFDIMFESGEESLKVTGTSTVEGIVTKLYEEQIRIKDERVREWLLKLGWRPPMNDGIELIAKERARQQSDEGFSNEHDDNHDDDNHDNGALAQAAALYAMPACHRDKKLSFVQDSRVYDTMLQRFWPWNFNWWRPCPTDRVRELVKAGALIVAEIDRLLRIKK